MFTLQAVPNSSVIVHPPGFYVIGFETFPHIRFYFIFLAFVYVVTLFFNSLLIYVIASNPCLHTPKFLAVVNLAVVDIVLNSSTIPSMIRTFLLKENFFPFNLCLLQMFTYYSFATLECYALAILAYDRLIAICFPLQHNSINTLWTMSCIVAVVWCYALGLAAFSVGIMTWLSFCKSVTVYSYFCDYAPTFRLACNDNTLHWAVSSTASVVNFVVPCSFIVLTYAAILVTLFGMKSVKSRMKALATCVEHLILVTVFYIPLLTIFVLGFYVRLIEADRRVLSLSLASCIPPCLNPIVYSLKTREIKIRVVALIRKSKIRVIKA